MKSGLQKDIDNLSAVDAKQCAFAPGRCQQYRAGVFRSGPHTLEPLCHLIHIRNTDFNQLFCRQLTFLFKAPNAVDLIITGKQNRIIIVQTKHSVHDDLTGSMRDMYIALHFFRTLPLVNIQSGGR